MKRLVLFSIIGLMATIFTSCATSNYTRGNQYPKMYAEKPVTVLVMPPINNTNHVAAKELLYTSIARPLAEAGYYVIPPFLTMEILRAESAYDSELFIEGKFDKFKQFFGADAVVFSVIDVWEKQGFGINTKIHYIIKSAKTNEIIFDRSCDLYLDLSVKSGSSGLLGTLADLAASAINTALTEHIKAARKTNEYIFMDIPRGPYNHEYLNDMDEAADKKDIKKTVK
ncbi:MAG: DUF799 family lipoprotein [Bacteroidales bacterium]|jgi:hypothetical protein|nr:DUF799 family lipoprotein [Bacteroidales bacterium]MBR6092065.1 DUF799 family lipoprotein [Bacteroidales bacterium]